MKISRTIAVLLLSSTLVLAKNPKVGTELDSVNPSTTVDVIVQFKTPPTKDDLKQLGPYGQMKKVFTTSTPSASLQAAKSLDCGNPDIKFISKGDSGRSV